MDVDDDTPDTSRSEITRNLAAGDYTVEATTFERWGDWQLHADGERAGRRDHDGAHRPGPWGDGQLRRDPQR